MRMKKLCHIFLAAVMLWGCNQEAEDITLTQMNRIASFLSSNHTPRLIDEANLGDYMDDDNLPQFYTVFGRASFRYIANYYDSGRDSRREAVRGSRLTVTYSAYNFSDYRVPTISQLYATNDTSLREQMEAAGWTLDENPFFTFEPLTVTLGRGDIISGVDAALAGCREGDKVEIYCTSSRAYGDKLIGILPADTPVCWYITIDEIE